VFVVLLVSTFVVIGIGVQAFLWQRATDSERLADERHDAKTEACTKEWAEGMRATITSRSGITLELETALARRNDAIDQIILDVATRPVGAEPSQDELDDFRHDLDEFVAAKENLDKVKAKADETRSQNPYPQFDPNCMAGQMAAEKVT
jgi:soluble cytochrome b562